MHYIAHRINELENLRKLPPSYGAEIDLRDRGERLILQHDPFKDGEDCEPFIAEYKHGILILNVKSERIEFRILELINKYKIPDYFFLDCSIPMIVTLSKQGVKKIAVRYSEFESIETVLNFAGLVDWVWIDCFTKLPCDRASLETLKAAGFKLCLVSPELQGRPADLQVYKHLLVQADLKFDAICTKLHNINAWKQDFD